MTEANGVTGDGAAGAPARLPAPARRLLVGTCVSALGNGLVLPFLVVYLGQVRGLGIRAAGLVVAWQALVSFAFAPIAGTLIDRFGPRRVLLVGPLVMAFGTASYALVDSLPAAFVAAGITAVGGSAGWPAGATMLAQIVGDDLRQRAFGIQFMLLNLGIGVGGLVSGLIIDVSRPITFQLLYVGDALTFVVYVAIVWSLHGYGGPVVTEPGQEPLEGGYRDLVRDRRLRGYVAVSLLMLTGGYGALEVGYPAFSTQVIGVSPRTVAFGYVLNTLLIVVGQLYALKVVEGRSRSYVLAAVGLLWAVSWAVLGVAGLVTSAVTSVVLVLLAPAVFAVGETLYQPVAPAILNQLAPDHLRGRYNAVGSLVWNVAGVLGPGIAGLLIGGVHPSVFVLVVVVASLVAGLGGLRLRRLLTPAQDGRAPARAAPSVGDFPS